MSDETQMSDVASLTDAEKVQAWVREHRPSEGFGFSVAAWSDLLDLFTAARADESERVAAVAEERDAALAEVRDLLDVLTERDDLRGRLAAVEAVAERAERKGYDLDPVEVLEACNMPAQEASDD